MALTPRIRTIEPEQLPIDKMPIERLKDVVPESSPLGKGLAKLPVEELQGSGFGPDAQAQGSADEQIIGLLGVPNSDPADLF